MLARRNAMISGHAEPFPYPGPERPRSRVDWTDPIQYVDVAISPYARPRGPTGPRRRARATSSSCPDWTHGRRRSRRSGVSRDALCRFSLDLVLSHRICRLNVASDRSVRRVNGVCPSSVVLAESHSRRTGGKFSPNPALVVRLYPVRAECCLAGVGGSHWMSDIAGVRRRFRPAACEPGARPRPAGAGSASTGEIPDGIVSPQLSNRWSTSPASNMIHETSIAGRCPARRSEPTATSFGLHLLVAAQVAT